MKKLFTLSFFVLFFWIEADSQSIVSNTRIAYYDAIYFNSFLKEHKKIKIQADNKKLFEYYFFGDSTKNISVSVIDKVVLANPFFDTTIYSAALGGAQAPLNIKIPNVTNFLGSINVSNLAEGVSSFLVKRAKQELLISVVDKLKDTDRFPELPILFPNTIKLMQSFHSWEYSNVLNTLKEAFDKDLQQLLGDIPNLNTLKIDSSQNSAYNKYDSAAKKRVQSIYAFFQTPESRIYISAMQIGNGIITGEKMPDIIHTISSLGYLGDLPGASADFNSAIRFFDIISYSVRSNVNGESYINKDSLASLIHDPNLRRIYFGLLYQQLKNEQIQFGGTVNIADIVGKDYNGMSTYLSNLISQSCALDVAIKNLNDGKKKGEKDLTSYWAAIFESTKQFLLTSANVSLIDQSLTLPNQIQETFSYSSKVLGIANDIAIRNYSAAVVDFNNFIPNNLVNEKFRVFFVKYGSFVANLVQAKNADDAENAIEAVALPVGSYTIKQNSNWNISVNGYLGYAKDGNYAQGIYGPIGVSITRKIFFWLVPSWHIPTTIFIPIFDVGSIASYQLANPNTTGTSTTNGMSSTTLVNTSTSNQQIKLGSIFAPGVELFFEIPKTPFAIGYGMRRTPTLSYSSGQSYLTVGSRWVNNFTILVDIPILTLFNRTQD